jgi:cellulose synthase/poly-beta-1,6-N-acetylglucosamine synthase-like glycosyltransferase
MHRLSIPNWRSIRSILQAIQIGLLLWLFYMIFMTENTHLDMFNYIMLFMGILIINIIIFAYVEIIEILTTLATVTEYAFGKDATPEECLEKIARWAEEEGVDIKILKD